MSELNLTDLAYAIARESGYDSRKYWEHSVMWPRWRKYASAVIQAADQLGYVLVPKEATGDMVRAIRVAGTITRASDEDEAAGVWSAALRARPSIPSEPSP